MIAAWHKILSKATKRVCFDTFAQQYIAALELITC